MKLKDLRLGRVGSENRRLSSFRIDNDFDSHDLDRIKSHLPLLEKDAKRRGMIAKKGVMISTDDVYADFGRVPNSKAALSVELPPFLMRKKVPYSGFELVVSIGRKSYSGYTQVVVAVYDRDFKEGRRKYYHPHSVNDSGYVCSRHFTHHMTRMLVEGNVQTMIPYAIRVVSKGGQEAVHHNIHGIPWCKYCHRWIGDVWEGAYEATKKEEVFPSGPESLSPDFRVAYHNYLRESGLLVKDCRRCIAGGLVSVCPSCMEELSVKCSSCEKVICPMHDAYISDEHYSCYKGRGKDWL